MSSYLILTVIICISACFAYINHRYIKMPFVIGLFFLSTVVSLVIFTSRFWFPRPYDDLKVIVKQANISKFILEIMLGYLLFAGSLHTHWNDIKKYIKQITLFAVGGVLVSTIIIAALIHLACHLLQIEIEFIYCLLFGALISPTDPIAVLGILTKANVPKKIESIIVGESLFNDGIGVVVFLALLETLETGSTTVNYAHFGTLFLQEAAGGVAAGLVFGFSLHKLLKSIDHYETEVLLTIAFVMAGYSFCLFFHLSGALAVVVMGLLVGNYKQELAMSDRTQEYVHKFWELVDIILNAILFIVIALVLVVIDFKTQYLILGVVSVIVVLLSRLIVVYVPGLIAPKKIDLNKKESRLIVWGGLRGGLSVALVLSLPDSEARNILLVATYACVLFSILVQGLTIEKLAKR
ncbi:MAG: sodium:proton antiporter [Bacteroidetes bacterium]|nr:sodium:proton antiporter [Bacteroidota bacterium]